MNCPKSEHRPGKITRLEPQGPKPWGFSCIIVDAMKPRLVSRTEWILRALPDLFAQGYYPAKLPKGRFCLWHTDIGRGSRSAVIHSSRIRKAVLSAYAEFQGTVTA